MTQQELIARAEDLISAWNHADVDRIVSAFCVEARESVRLDAEEVLERYPGIELEVVRTVAAGNVVTTEWIARSHNGEPGRPGASVADYDERGRISRLRRYLGPAVSRQPPDAL